MNVVEELKNNADEKYKDFHSALVPNLPKERLIGVRIPVLRKIAKKVSEENYFELGSYYYEEIMLKGMVIGYKKCSVEERFKMLDDFVPLINNWAVCDCSCSTYKFVNKNKSEVWNYILPYIEKSEFEKRFAIVMMMDYFLDDEYIDKVLDIVSKIKTDEYYVNMASAWLLSVAYVKYKDKTEKLILSVVLSDDVHNKTIQKIRESNRVSSVDKEKLKKYKK